MIHMRQNYQSTMVWRNRKWLTQKINFPIDFTRIQKISRTKDEEIKFNFFLNIVSKDKCAEHNGYCYRLSNDEGLSIKCNTKIIYMSRLDMLPKNPTTMKTYDPGKQMSFEDGQRCCIYTCDHPLYCIAALPYGKDFLSSVCTFLWVILKVSVFLWLGLVWKKFSRKQLVGHLRC